MNEHQSIKSKNVCTPAAPYIMSNNYMLKNTVRPVAASSVLSACSAQLPGCSPARCGCTACSTAAQTRGC
jgi:TctA family transporter